MSHSIRFLMPNENPAWRCAGRGSVIVPAIAGSRLLTG